MVPATLAFHISLCEKVADGAIPSLPSPYIYCSLFQ